jgi:hypothetical protein
LGLRVATNLAYTATGFFVVWNPRQPIPLRDLILEWLRLEKLRLLILVTLQVYFLTLAWGPKQFRLVFGWFNEVKAMEDEEGVCRLCGFVVEVWDLLKVRFLELFDS